MVRDHLKDIFKPLSTRLCGEKKRIKDQGRYFWWFPRITCPNIYIKNCLGGKLKIRICSLASHLGVLDDDFEEFLDEGKLSKVWSWHKNLVLHVQTHIDSEITWIVFDEACALFQWACLPRDQIIGINTPTAWFFWPTCGWVEISSGEEKCLDEIC